MKVTTNAIRQFDPTRRCQTLEGICEYLNITPATYRGWRALGLVPGPITGTSRYDLRQHDMVLDQRAGLAALTSSRPASPLEQFEAGLAR